MIVNAAKAVETTQEVSVEANVVPFNVMPELIS
jgi:hypothetical protein